MTILQSTQRCAIVVAHPGHELRVYGWLASRKPDVYILTDGSGHTDTSRLDSSAQLVDGAGATRGAIFGRLTDREAYAAILGGNSDLFASLAAELAEGFVTRDVRTVVGDAVEGYNPAHDICRLLIDAAVSIARTRGAVIENYDFAVVDKWASDPQMTVTLDDEAFEAKMGAVRAYERMRQEVDALVERDGLDAFRSERFRLRAPGSSLAPRDAKPFYETHGERQVEAGIYRDVVRYREHVARINDEVLAASGRLVCVR